jgi:regulator of protease activity HflC (stomatin/prohibitin superfamily)
MDIIAGVLSLVALVFILAWFVIRLVLLSCTVLEHERGLLYRRGRFQRVLNPGGYWFLRRMCDPPHRYARPIRDDPGRTC